MKNILLKVIGIVLAIGCAPAVAVDPASQPGTTTPAVHQQTLVASAVGYVAQATSGGLAHAGSLQLPSGTASSSNDSRVALSMVPVPGGSSSHTSRTPDRQQGGGYLVSVAAVPEPSGGAMLLCGLAVLAFIARRKTRPVAD